jgi:hypothetical protein
LERLEPDDGKLSCPVLRGLGGSNAPRLPGARYNPIRYNDPTGHAVGPALHDSYGDGDPKGPALYLADYYRNKASNGTTVVYWDALSDAERAILSAGGWDKDSYNAHVSDKETSPADALHDPLTILELLVLGGGSLRAVSGLATAGSLLCADGICTNEVEAAQRGVTVLGRWPTYLEVARDVGGNALNDPAMTGMTKEEAWAVNQAFLDAAVARGDYFYLASNWAKAVPGSFFARELNYLITVYHYTIAPGRPWLIPPDY